ncbi:D-glycero-D-manno-heptose 1,7-bisphosphate phosphatase [Nitrosomonas sp. Nm51]|uniref:D-glycero-beta-D-manno-heptose 1,7-bisphosphate 7-phosphatase n=1 Tax=Nitrosomonas sp. Nm51 TaxID=133720 RepID=UPI0008AD462C|nr:D-glycero-beta-D-manno-heptose 1,7-bisphosphate 7-phosphatase [Nitrosomonas sp. Nm51]SER06886.1 D-glycero-D-manno-heptose 1,7-bisphosphate phosphatase [Nitrosomonas sp. Nm51]
MKLVILDHNGVINQSSDTFIKTPDEWEPIPGSIEAIARLTQSGYRIVTATNQSGIGRGLLDMVTFNAINDKMYKVVAQAGGHIDSIFFCPHTSADKCRCRKPKTGMFEEIMQRYGTDLKNTPTIGDAMRDLVAAEAVGALPILVLTGKGKVTQEQGALPPRTQVYDDLAAAVNAIVGYA